MSAAEGLRAIELGQLQVSNTGSQAERRKHFDKNAIAELAESIKTVGLLSPIVARPVNGHFEVVAGERRFLAAQKAGLTAINVSVRALTDEQVLEIQLIENLQREGLHELAEAEGYEALHKLGHSAEEIADKVGKSKAYIYARMKLIALSPKARKAFYEDKINASIALLLARIPVEALQVRALEDILDHNSNYASPLSFREAQEIIQQEYTCRLDDAGFKTEDETLLPAAGACGACPKRTGNQPELFGDIKRADVCTDPVCFRAKRDAAAARLAAEGAKVIQGKPAEKIVSNDRAKYDSGFVELESRPYEDPKNRTAAQLLGKDYEPTLVQDPESGKVLKLAKKSDVAAALKSAGVKTGAPSNPQSAAEKKAKAEREFRKALFARVRESYPKALERADWNDLVTAMVHEMQQETVKQLFALWGWEPVKEKYGNGDYRAAAAAYIKKLSGTDMSKLMFDCIFVSDLQVSTWGDRKPEKLFAAAKRFKVNAEQVRRNLNAATIPKTKKKPKGKK
jgi:ParB/RepB/Spo0J family partition protein